jgi:hypothetical protein
MMKSLAYVAIITGVGIIAFWIAFFTIGLAPENAPACYVAYEHSFPLPDAVLSLGLIAGGVMVLRDENKSVWLLPSAGGLIFLGLVDFAFNVQNSMYTISLADGILNACINLWCVILGCIIIMMTRNHFRISK